MSDAYAEFEKEILGEQAPVVPEPEKVEEPVAEETETPEEIEAGDETLTTDDPPEETQDVELPEDLNSLAEAIGVPIEKLYTLEMGLPGGGKMTLGQYKDNAVKYGNIDEKISQLDKQREDLAQQKAEISQLRTQAMTMPDELLQAQARVKQIEAAYQSVNWAEFEANDPGKAALEKQNLTMTYTQAQNQANVILDQVQRNQQDESQKMAAEYGQRLKAIIPEWSDQKDIDLTTFMVDEGIPVDVIKQIPFTESGEVFVKMVDELRKLRLEKAEADATVKKVQSRPISLKTGAAGAKLTAKTRKSDALINNAREKQQTGKHLSRQDQEAAERAVFERYE